MNDSSSRSEYLFNSAKKALEEERFGRFWALIDRLFDLFEQERAASYYVSILLDRIDSRSSQYERGVGCLIRLEAQATGVVQKLSRMRMLCWVSFAPV